MMWNDLKRLGQFKDLLIAMTLRDIQVRYKQTFLGAAWAVAQTLGRRSRRAVCRRADGALRLVTAWTV